MQTAHRDTITSILETAKQDTAAAEELLPLIYVELKRLAAGAMAKEMPGQTLQPTALVHEADLRLVGNPDLHWNSRGHFFAAAARSMRQILIDRAHQKHTLKRGGNFKRAPLDVATCAQEPDPEWLIALDEALERLEAIDARKGRIVNLRYFAGLTIDDTARALNLSARTIKKEWQFARAWLHRELTR